MHTPPYRDGALPDHERELAIAQRLSVLQSTDGERAELERQHRALREQSHRRRLQLLGTLTIAAPCPANWADMQGDDTQRFCGTCEKHVFNLSAMTEVQAARFVQREKSACVRFFQRADGTILTQDCPVGIKIRRRKNRMVAALAAGLGLAGAMGLATAALRLRPPNCTLRSGARDPSSTETGRPRAAGEHPAPAMVGTSSVEWRRTPPPR
jgi:hypothetical protein